MMDDLRPGMDERDSFEDEQLEEAAVEGIDAAVIDRLASYGHGSEADRSPMAVDHPAGDESFAPEVGAVDEDSGDKVDPAYQADAHADITSEADVVSEVVPAHELDVASPLNLAVEDDHAVEAVVEHPTDEDAPDVEHTTSGASEPEPRKRFGVRLRRSSGTSQRRERIKAEKRPRNLIGLEIGASQIAAAHVLNNGAPELVEVFREPLPPGLVVSGEIRDPDALGDALKRFFELHKLPKRGVRLGLSNNRIGVRVFEIEGVTDPSQLENAIRFRAEEVLPIPLDEAVLDYVVLADDVREDGTSSKRILLVVAYREVVDRYLQACRGAGLEVVGIDLEAFALLRSLEAPGDRDPGAGALVAAVIGHDRTTIAVSTGRFCEFTRVLDWGGWSLNVAIARELDRAPSEVESIKRQLSFAHETSVEGLTPEQVTKTRNAVERALASFSRELVASLHFYQAQPGALGIGEVVLTGGTAHMDGLPDAIGQLVGVPVRLGDPFKRVKVGPNITHEAQHGSVAVAVGLGIED